MRRTVDIAPGVRLWSEARGPADAPPLLLIMGAATSALGWPEEFVDALAARHRVIRYDHRDTGRSTRAYESRPYRVADLAEDALGVLDAHGAARAHVVGLSLGGLLTQLLLADHPERLLSATLLGTCALSEHPLTGPDGTETAAADLPGIDPRVLEMWACPAPDHGPEAELDRRVAHWRLLSGDELPFHAEELRERERRDIEHAGRHDVTTAHGRADASGLLRTAELARNTVPTLVVEATAEPVFPPPHARHLAQVIAGARLVVMPGIGHALPRECMPPLADAILEHTGACFFPSPAPNPGPQAPDGLKISPSGA
ncbi:alpha/beta fold hydrolase [Streptomyces albireticuli]|uniref:Alpha/beta hydrolase n=1 Tax=Streptomyces albireticuli TaxID=1940 RepID=A0A2A2D2Z1_9ACTN|nr:alpha/beta fold hydrolase [Streptomyces albireticuli]MCD9142867.1 alpha/beta fold hydrolase [Streptomyces albireticuli]MCD9162814.1 alpha/beta fold hydrolase [Streptomyces albireticuli]MCD9192374.1 alpha/beta fold hydrolase [Streptomyces albireticuli]PAU45885.1 alpha/beta hydrolase [Streptomyces albireticuli]